MADKVARRLLGDLLAAARIDESTFYRLAGALFECPHIDPESVMLTEPARGQFELTARYTGKEQIGHASSGKRRINPDIKRNVEKIYGRISRKSGIKFKGAYPSIDEADCTGYVKLDSSNTRSSPLLLTLYQTVPETGGVR